MVRNFYVPTTNFIAHWVLTNESQKSVSAVTIIRNVLQLRQIYCLRTFWKIDFARGWMIYMLAAFFFKIISDAALLLVGNKNHLKRRNKAP